MPEAPEVHTVIHALIKLVVGQKIVEIEAIEHSVVKNPLNPAVNKYIADIKRHGKYIDFVLSDDAHLIVHLGMTGYFRTNEQPGYIFSLKTTQTSLFFYDPRKFGKVWYLNKEEFQNFIPIKSLGPDAMFSSPAILEEKLLIDRTAHKNKVIKTYLMDGHNISGLGNIYANEALYLAKILPTRKLSTLTDIEIKLLAKEIPKLLQRSFHQGGSTIKSFSSVNGHTGNYQERHYVYQQVICRECRGEITRIKQSGRSTFFCATEQK